MKPRSYVFIAARTISDNDHAPVLRFADVAALVSAAVGGYSFGPISSSDPTSYVGRPVPSHIELDRVLFRACQDLQAIKSTEPIEPTISEPRAPGRANSRSRR